MRISLFNIFQPINTFLKGIPKKNYTIFQLLHRQIN